MFDIIKACLWKLFAVNTLLKVVYSFSSLLKQFLLNISLTLIVVQVVCTCLTLFLIYEELVSGLQ